MGVGGLLGFDSYTLAADLQFPAVAQRPHKDAKTNTGLSVLL